MKYRFGSFRAHSIIYLDFLKAFDKVHLTSCSLLLKAKVAGSNIKHHVKYDTKDRTGGR